MSRPTVELKSPATQLYHETNSPSTPQRALNSLALSSLLIGVSSVFLIAELEFLSVVYLLMGP